MERINGVSYLETNALIGKEEIEVLKDILKRCYFENDREIKEFWTSVLNEVGVNALEEIRENEFELAFNTAMNLLRKKGDSIYRRTPITVPCISKRKEFKVKRRF